MVSTPHGVTWTSQVSAADNPWNGVAFGNDLFVAVADTGTGDRVMMSPVLQGLLKFGGVASVNDLFVAGADTGTGDRVMLSSATDMTVMCNGVGCYCGAFAICTQCATWFYSDALSSDCSQCPAGSYSSTRSSASLCPPGTISQAGVV